MFGRRNKHQGGRRYGFRPTLETLEDRSLMSVNGFVQTNLVSDIQGLAANFDPNLKNPWGISESSGSPFWISDNNSGQSTLYNTAGVPQSLVVSIPTPVDPFGASGAPTGTVFNTAGGPTGGFQVSGFSNPATGDPAPTSAAAIFLFATEDGTIVGWNPGVNPQGFDPTKAGTYGILAVDNSGNNFTEPDPNLQTGAVYKGLAIGQNSAGDTLLYAANFRAGTIDVFNSSFQQVQLKGKFHDNQVPAGYAPFNVQNIGDKLYVTYAKQDDTKHDDVAGVGHGFVDVYSLDGKLEKRLIQRGDLNSPWGLAIAPATFGQFAGDLLVGNFGDGKIHAYDPNTGAFRGTLTNEDGQPIQIDGLWALKVGNGGSGGDANTIYFTAGLNHEMDGLFGSLTPGETVSQGAKVDADLIRAVLRIDPGAQRFFVRLHDRLEAAESSGSLTQAQADLEQALDIVLAQGQRQSDTHGEHHHRNEAALDHLFADLANLFG